MTATPASTSSTPSQSMSTPSTVEVGRARIDAIDAELVRLIRERLTVSAEVQQVRLLTGGPRIVHARENEVVLRWREQLGRPGASIAMALIELGRGPAT